MHTRLSLVDLDQGCAVIGVEAVGLDENAQLRVSHLEPDDATGADACVAKGWRRDAMPAFTRDMHRVLIGLLEILWSALAALLRLVACALLLDHLRARLRRELMLHIGREPADPNGRDLELGCLDDDRTLLFLFLGLCSLLNYRFRCDRHYGLLGGAAGNHAYLLRRGGERIFGTEYCDRVQRTLHWLITLQSITGDVVQVFDSRYCLCQRPLGSFEFELKVVSLLLDHPRSDTACTLSQQLNLRIPLRDRLQQRLPGGLGVGAHVIF